MTHFYLLVCEGSCNPRLAALDEAVRRERRNMGYEVVSLSLGLLAALREARHTEHAVTLHPDIYRCAVCQHDRQYGGAPRPWMDPLVSAGAGR
jgi:hypothetical protein